eukprot:CAMPEP_0116064574 /NCGR_PEP_ID=MMETSP0322-20121206/9204_1 /TAXON_ID=163516 /ORGANISM="Leptocylindrus danicus var. apora, Strain B651" /LENGTH=660 /DNA_ID=CAMNT_0003550635 /DNA_START=270 /DNA_END=2250 /DNA_ORIENTATION=+
MRIATPQITLHASQDNGKNAPILATSILRSGILPNAHVLATGGANREVQLWKIHSNRCMDDDKEEDEVVTKDSSDINAMEDDNDFHKDLNHPQQQIQHQQQQQQQKLLEHICTLSRSERTINALQFSPDGLYLAAVGDGGTVLVWSVPQSKRGGGNGRHYWGEIVQKESNLLCRIVHSLCEDLFDVSWCSDSRRFVTCSLDHSVVAFDLVKDDGVPTNTSFSSSGPVSPTEGNDGVTMEMEAENGMNMDRAEKWVASVRVKEHTHYVQGVAYDPLGVYVASQGSDRTVRVMKRKQPGSKQLLKQQMKMNSEERVHMQMESLADVSNKFEVDGRAKVIKFKAAAATLVEKDKITSTCTQIKDDSNGVAKSNNKNNSKVSKKVRDHLYADEATESFFRRLNWTPDGAFLITPSALWPRRASSSPSCLDETSSVNNASSSSFSTLLFIRHKFDQPIAVLSGHDKASVVVRCCPVHFKIPKDELADTMGSEKENAGKTRHLKNTALKSNLPYRSVFAVLTTDSIYIYDTYRLQPLAYARGLHYTSLTDAAWTEDGMQLVVTSSDGYLSIVSFEEGELGEVYIPSPKEVLEKRVEECPSSPDNVCLPPCTKGENTDIEVPSAKREGSSDCSSNSANRGEKRGIYEAGDNEYFRCNNEKDVVGKVK